MVFYPEAARDTDVLAQAAAEGLEISAQLRSVDSPEDLHLAIDVPDGYTVRNAGGNTVAIAHNSKLVAAVLPPSAVDAQGTVVPTSLRAVGNDVIMHVAHKSGSFAYPILADPTISADWGSSPSTAWKYGNNLSTMGYWGAAWYKPSIAAGVQTSISAFSSPFSAYTAWISGRPTMPTQIGSGSGLWLWAAPTTLTGKTYAAGDWVESYTTAPGGANSYFQGMQWNYQTLNGGSQNSDANLVLVNGLYSPARNTWVSTALRANNVSTVDYNVTLSTTATDARQAATLLEFFGTDSRTDWATAYQGGVVATVSDTDRPNLSPVTWHTSSSYTNGADGNKPTFDYTATDGGLGVSGVRLYVDGAPVTKYTTNDSAPAQPYGCTGFWDHPCPLNDVKTGNSYLELNSVVDGTHTVQLTAVDSLGKESDLSNSATIKLDHTGPVATVGGVNTNAKLGDGAFTIDASATDGLSRTDTLAMAVDGKVTSPTPDGQVVRACTRTAGTHPACSTVETNKLANSWTLRGEDLAEGSHEISVGAMDSLGNYTQTLAKVTVNIHHADTTSVGPGEVNLLTGDFSVSASDTSIPAYTASLGLSRTYHSRGFGAVSSGVFGPGWTTNLPTESESWAYASLTANSDNSSIWVTTAAGEQLAFTKSGSTYISPDSAPDLTLRLVGSSPSESFTLTDIDGNVTTFASKKAGSNATSIFYPSSSQGPLASSAVSYAWDTSATPVRPTAEIGPQAPGTTCTQAAQSAGCKILFIDYGANGAVPASDSPSDWSDYGGQIKTLTLKTYSDSGVASSDVVAQYQYDAHGRLRAEWDPRITPNLKTTYDYDSQGNLTKLTPPGQQPWNMSYATISGDSANGRLATVSRTDSDLGQTPTWTMAYNVPLSGADAPFQMAASDVAAWGQASDAPAYATAVIPPDGTSSSYAKATITYMDQYGREVNTADRAGAITSTRYEAGSDNIVRQLTAANRVRALAAGANSASVADSLATIRTYSTDHAVMIDEQGPTHTVKLEDGSTAQARAHTHVTYDAGAPASGGPYHLATTLTVSALVGTADRDTRTVSISYSAASGASGWVTHQPTARTVTVDGTAAADLTSAWVYDADTGQVTSARLPGNSAGGDAHDTRTTYYSPGSSDPECRNKMFVGLPCKKAPVAQPSGTGANRPVIPTTFYATYDRLAHPTEIREIGSQTRTTTVTYDEAGRQIATSVDTPSGMTAVPSTTSVYSSTQGSQVGLTRSSGASAISWTLDGWGRTTAYSDASGNVSTRSYDLLGRIASENDGKGSRSYTYDSATARTTKIADSVVGNFTADPQAGYDADGNITAETLPGGLLKTTTVDEAGSLIDISYKKSSNTWYADHSTGSVFGQVRDETGTQGHRTTAYDSAGRLTSVTDTPTGQVCSTRKYSYDRDSNRLGAVSYPAAAGGTCQSTSGGSTTSRSYDEADRLSGTSYSYDAFGNTLTVPAADAGGSALVSTYFADNRVRSLSQGGVVQTFAQDPAGRTSTTTVTGGTTSTNHYDGQSDAPVWIAEDLAGAHWTRNALDLNGDLAAISDETGSAVLQLTNIHGDIAATASASVNASGISSLQGTDEFGVPQGASAARYGYVGDKQRPNATSSGTVLMGQRVYQPSLGRFLQTDPVPGGSANAYDYANQDPVNQFDPTGCAPSFQLVYAYTTLEAGKPYRIYKGTRQEQLCRHYYLRDWYEKYKIVIWFDEHGQAHRYLEYRGLHSRRRGGPGGSFRICIDKYERNVA